MKVTIDIDYIHELGDLLWGKAYHAYKRIVDADLGDELLELLEGTFDEPHILEISDFLAYEFDVNKFIATNTRLCDIPSIDALIYYAYQLGYPEAHDKIEEFMASGKAEELWNYLKDNFSNYSLNKVFSEVVELEDVHE